MFTSRFLVTFGLCAKCYTGCIHRPHTPNRGLKSVPLASVGLVCMCIHFYHWGQWATYATVCLYSCVCQILPLLGNTQDVYVWWDVNRVWGFDGCVAQWTPAAPNGPHWGVCCLDCKNSVASSVIFPTICKTDVNRAWLCHRAASLYHCVTVSLAHWYTRCCTQIQKPFALNCLCSSARLGSRSFFCSFGK